MRHGGRRGERRFPCARSDSSPRPLLPAPRPAADKVYVHEDTRLFCQQSAVGAVEATEGSEAVAARAARNSGKGASVGAPRRAARARRVPRRLLGLHRKMRHGGRRGAGRFGSARSRPLPAPPPRSLPLAGAASRKFSAGRSSVPPYKLLSLEWKGARDSADGLVIKRLRTVAEGGGGGGGASYKGKDWNTRLATRRAFVIALGHRPTSDDVKDGWCPSCSAPHEVEDMVECERCFACYHISCAAFEERPIGIGEWVCKKCSAAGDGGEARK